MSKCLLGFGLVVLLVVAVFAAPVEHNRQCLPESSCLAPVMGSFLHIAPKKVLPLDMYAPQQRFAINVERLANEAKTLHRINPDLVYDIMHTLWHLSNHELDIAVSNLIHDFGKNETAYALYVMFHFYSGAGRDTVNELDRFGTTFFKFLKRDPLIVEFAEQIRRSQMLHQKDAVPFLIKYFPKNAYLFSVMYFYHQMDAPRFFRRFDFMNRSFKDLGELVSIRHDLGAEKQETMTIILEKIAVITAPFILCFEETEDLYDGIEKYLDEVDQDMRQGLKVKGLYLMSGAQTMMELSRQYAYHSGWSENKFNSVFQTAGINMAVLDNERDYYRIPDQTKELALRYLDQLGVLDGDVLYVYDSGFRGTIVKFIQDLVRDNELVGRVLPGRDLSGLKVSGRLIYLDDSDVELWRDIEGMNENNLYTGEDCRTFAWLTDDDAGSAIAGLSFSAPRQIAKYSPYKLYETPDGTVDVEFRGSRRTLYNVLGRQFLRIGQKHWNERDISYLLGVAA